MQSEAGAVHGSLGEGALTSTFTAVMTTRQTGFGLLAAGSVQEVMDLADVAHLTAIKGRVPFVHLEEQFNHVLT